MPTLRRFPAHGRLLQPDSLLVDRIRDDLVGACAVSWHGDTELCFDTIERLYRARVEQINIHAVTVDAVARWDRLLASKDQIPPGFYEWLFHRKGSYE